MYNVLVLKVAININVPYFCGRWRRWGMLVEGWGGVVTVVGGRVGIRVLHYITDIDIIIRVRPLAIGYTAVHVAPVTTCRLPVSGANEGTTG